MEYNGDFFKKIFSNIDSKEKAKRLIDDILEEDEIYDIERDKSLEILKNIDEKPRKCFKEACEDKKQNIDQKLNEMDNNYLKDLSYTPIGAALGAGIGHLAGDSLTGLAAGSYIGALFSGCKFAKNRIDYSEYVDRREKLNKLKNQYLDK